jgi:hypothetical protein
MWSKKWYLKRNTSCDAHLLNELLETDVLWYDAIVVSAGKLRKLWDSLSELRSSLCERRLGRTVLRPALLPVKTAQFTQFFRQIWRHTVKSLNLTECIGRFTQPARPPSPLVATDDTKRLRQAQINWVASRAICGPHVEVLSVIRMYRLCETCPGVMNNCVRNFLTNWGTTSFSRMILLRGDSRIFLLSSSTFRSFPNTTFR